MKKTEIMKYMETYQECAEDCLLEGYPRAGQEEIAKISYAILKEICNKDGVTVIQAKYALKMAAEVLDVTAKHEIIS